MKASAPAVSQSGAAKSEIPGLRGTELVDAFFQLRSRPLEFLLDLATRYGPVVSMPFIKDPVILISSPEAIQYLLHQNHRNYRKRTERWKVFRQLVGKGLLTSDGDLWRRQRQRIQPAFHQSRIARFEAVIAEETSNLLTRWRRFASDGNPIGVFGEMLRLSMNIITRAMFGRDSGSFADKAMRAFAEAHNYINPMSLINLLLIPASVRRVLLPQFRGYEKAFRELDEIVERIVAERRRSEEDRDDFLSMLLTGRDEEHGEIMSPAQLRDEIITVFLAGHETTAICLTWTLYLLSKYPEARRELREEVNRVLEDRFPTMKDLPNLKLNEMVIKESLRLYPPAWGFDRKAVEDDELGGYRVPAGSTVAICSYVMHHHPSYWDNPEGFDPWRFTEEHSSGRPEYVYLPFGGGPRRCIGYRFALVEVQIVLAAIIQKFDVDLLPGPPIRTRPLVNLQPDRNFLMNLTDRSSETTASYGASI